MQPIDRLRPHHILCERFLDLDTAGRGAAFDRMSREIQCLLESGSEAALELIEGADKLCRACPDCRNGRCESPLGNEDQVRRLDRIVLQGLGLSYGAVRTVRELNEVIRRRAPFAFCRLRCPWKDRCAVFALAE